MFCDCLSQHTHQLQSVYVWKTLHMQYTRIQNHFCVTMWYVVHESLNYWIIELLIIELLIIELLKYFIWLKHCTACCNAAWTEAPGVSKPMKNTNVGVSERWAVSWYLRDSTKHSLNGGTGGAESCLACHQCTTCGWRIVMGNTSLVLVYCSECVAPGIV